MSDTSIDHDDVQELRARLAEAEALIAAIQTGEVDALVVKTPKGNAVYTLTGADRPYRTFVDRMHEGAFTVDADGTLLYANQAFAGLVDAPLESVLGRCVDRLFDKGGAWRPDVTGEPVERDLRTPAGRLIPVSLSVQPMVIDGRQFMTAVVRDLRAHRWAQRLRESEATQRLFVEHAPTAVAMFDRDMRYIVCSRRWTDEFDLPRDVAGRSHYELFPNLPEAWKEAHRRGLAGESIHADADMFPRADGRARHLKWEIHPWRDAGGDIGGIVIGTEDVSARVDAEARLRSSEERLRLATSSAQIATLEFDITRMSALWKPPAHDILGLDTSRWVSLDEIIETVHPDDQDRIRAAIAASMDPGGSGLYSEEFRVQHAKTGEVRWAWSRGQVMFEGEGADRHAVRYVGVVTDISALRARNRQLDLLARTSQRLLTAETVDPELVASIGADIARSIDMESFYHYRPGPEPGVLTLAAHGGVSAREQRLFETMRFGELLCGRVAEAQQRIIVEDLQHSTHPGSEVLQGAGATSYAGFPLVAGGRLVGTLAFVSRRRTYLGEGDVQTVQTICDQIAVASERVRLERDIRRSEERALLALEGGELGSWDVDLASGRALWNRRHAVLQGHSPEGPHSLESWQRLVHPDDLGEVLAVMDQARVTQTAFTAEHRLHRADTGEERWLALYGRYSYDEDGRAVRVSGVSRDVTERRRAEEAQQQFVRLADEAGDFIGMATTDGQAVYVNPAGRALIGLETGDVSKTTILDHVPEEDREWFSSTVLATVLAKGSWEGETRLRHFTTGEPIDVLQKVFTIRDAKTNAPVRFATTAVDVRDQKRAAAELIASEARFRQMADQTPIVMWVTDAHGEIEFVNQAYCVFFGVTSHQVRESGWRLPVHPEDGDYEKAFQEALAAHRPFHASARVRRADGEWRWVASVAHPRLAADGTFNGMVGVSPDVTDQRRASELEREAARQKDEFIAVLAHELRNPLAPIRTSVGVLRASGPAEPKLAKCRDIIDRQVTHMARLLDDLLDVSRLSRGKLTLQPAIVRLRDVVADAVETVRPVIDDRRHTLAVEDIDPGLVLEADPARLAQVLTNLLNNAAKYTNPGGTIDLCVDARGDSIAIRVRDNGIGLRPEVRERIFDLFTQVEDARHRADGGLGIGLGLTKRLVEMHGGTISADSPGPLQGSTFTVTLPVHPRARQAPEPFAAAAPAAAHPRVQRRVLVVDDNMDAADTIAMLLDTLGCETRIAYDGHTALAEAERFQPDLILLDLGMPGIDGQTVCHRLRAEPWGVHTVVAAVTGWGQEEDRRRTRIAGFDFHLVKPVEPETLERLVRDLPRQHVM